MQTPPPSDLEQLAHRGAELTAALTDAQNVLVTLARERSGIILVLYLHGWSQTEIGAAVNMARDRVGKILAGAGYTHRADRKGNT